MIDLKTTKNGDCLFDNKGNKWYVVEIKNSLLVCKNETNRYTWFSPFELFYNLEDCYIYNFRNELTSLIEEAFELNLPNIEKEIQKIYKDCEFINNNRKNG